MVETFFDRDSSEVSAHPWVIRKYIANVCTKFEITKKNNVVPKALAHRLAG